MHRSASLVALFLFGCAPNLQEPAPRALVVAYPAVPTTLQPYRSGGEFTASVLRNVFEPLIDRGDGLELRACLAESWTNPDPRTWVFRLREDVLFHDGRPLLAADVVSFLKRALDDPRSRRGLTFVQSVEAEGPHTVIVRTDEPASILSGFFSGALIALEPEHPGGMPIGTGPYSVREWTKGERILLQAFDGHRDGPPAIPTVEFVATPSSHARGEQIRQGAAQLTIDLDPVDFSELRSNPAVETASRSGLRAFTLGMNALSDEISNGAANPLRRPLVRQALAYAIDKGELVRVAMGGHQTCCTIWCRRKCSVTTTGWSPGPTIRSGRRNCCLEPATQMAWTSPSTTSPTATVA